MYAVVTTGGKQYRVQAGSTLLVEKIVAVPGSSVTLDRVLLVGDGDNVTVGTPTVSGASVSATVLGEERGQKIVVFKFKQKVKYRRRTGHRQHLTRLRIDSITAAGKTERAAEPEKPVVAEQRETQPSAEAKKPRRSTRARAKAEPTVAEAPVEKPKADAEQRAQAAEAKPKRRARAKAPVADEAQDKESASEQAAEPSAQQPKPRGRRTAKPKNESAQEE